MPLIADSSWSQTQKMRGASIRYQVIESEIGYVRLIGRLDVRSVPQIEEEFQKTVILPKKPLIVDLSEVELMNSVGLGMLIMTSNSLSTNGIRMVLLNPQPKVEKVVRIARVDTLLPITHSLVDALKIIKADLSPNNEYILGNPQTTVSPTSSFGRPVR